MTSLWIRDKSAARALTGVTYLRGHTPLPRPGTVYERGAYRIRVTRPSAHWGHSVNVRQYGPVLHRTRLVYVVTRDGREVGRQVRWLCGTQTTTYELVARRPRGMRVCKQCMVRLEDVRIVWNGE